MAPFVRRCIRPQTQVVSEPLRWVLCSPMIALQVSKVDPGTPQEDAKKALIEKIDTYIQVW